MENENNLMSQPEATPQQTVEAQAPQAEAAPQATQPEAAPQEQPQVDISAEINNLYQPEPEQQSEEQMPQEPVEYNFDGVASENGANIGEADISTIRELGKELNLTNDQARNLLAKSDKYVNQNLQAKLQPMVMGWINEIKNDPQLGGDHFTETRGNLSRAIKRYGGDGAWEILNASGLGAHPAIVRMLAAVGRELAEEQKFVSSNVQPSRPKNILRSIYNNSPNLDFGD